MVRDGGSDESRADGPAAETPAPADSQLERILETIVPKVPSVSGAQLERMVTRADPGMTARDRQLSWTRTLQSIAVSVLGATTYIVSVTAGLGTTQALSATGIALGSSAVGIGAAYLRGRNASPK